MAKYRVPVLHSFCWQEAVHDKDLVAAPADPLKGDRYIVPKEGITPGDLWEGHENAIAWYDGCDWKFDIPDNGWHAFVQDEKLVYFFDGVDWDKSAGAAVASVGLYVDKNRTDTYDPNGSFSLPYKNITDAIDHIVEAEDNATEKGYVINIAPGRYDEDLVMDSTSLVNVMFKGTDAANVFIGAETGSTALKCISNNDSFSSLIFQGLTFLDDVELRGMSNGTLFGSNSMEIKQCQFSGSDLILQNVNNPILDDVGVTGNILWSNVNNGLVSGNQTFGTFTIESDNTAYKPAGWLGDSYGTVLQNIGHRIDDLQFNLINGGKSYVTMRSGGYASSTTHTIPVDASVLLYNSTLKGDWTLDGTLELNSGSYVTGILTENTGSTLNITGQKSSQLSIGQVPDGDQLTDGIIPLPAENKVAWALDELNEVMRCMAPPEPDPLTNVDLACTITTYTGKLPSGLSSRWYQDGRNAGDTVDVIIQDNMTLQSGEGDPYSFEQPATVPFVPLTTNSARFRQGNVGTLKAKHDDGGVGLTVVATLDIVANFVENPAGTFPRYPEVQDLTQWDNQGTGDPCTDAVVNLTNGKGNLEVTDVGTFNEFCLWQKMNAQINVQNMDEGYNSFSLLHDDLFPVAEETHEFKVFYDDDTNSLVFGTSPTIVENTLASSKYISGVRYYASGDTFDINFVGDHVYKKVYHISRVARFNFEAQNGIMSRNPSGIPHTNDSITVNETITIDRGNYYDLDTRMTAYLDHPWKSTVSETTPSEKRYVCTYGNVSTDVREYFLDEVYRLPDGAYDTIPGAITGQWNSQNTLNNGEAFVYDRGVQYPNHNTSGSLPIGNPDYSTGFTGDQVYVRAFRDNSDPHSAMLLTLPGLSASDVAPVGTGNVNVQIKLPTQTGWLDAGVPFNSALFTGVDGDGCRVSVNGDDWDLTFGTFSTANSGNMVIVRITFRNTNSKIDSTMQVDW